MEFSELYRAVIELYQETKSVKQTADTLGVSVVKVRRILITEGLWHSETSDAICKLYKKGLSTDEIAFQLGIGRKNVQAYIPYSRGVYGELETDDSVRSSLYRERKKDAYEAQKGPRVAQSTANTDNIIDFADYLSRTRIKATPDSPQLEIGKTIPYSPSGEYTYELKLELVQRSYDRTDYKGITENLSKEEFKDLMILGKTGNGFYRNVLVPSDMPLHNLHYLIQRAFGFQNSHLHAFRLLGSEFDKITDGFYGKWDSLRGSLFRCPNDLPDKYWDDNYDGRQSIKSWFRQKYTAPYNNYCSSDTYIFQKEFGNESTNNLARQLGIAPGPFKLYKLDNICGTFYMPESFNTLLERLTIGELLRPAEGLRQVEKITDQIAESVKHAEENINSLSKTDRENLTKSIRNLVSEHKSKNAAENGMYNEAEEDDTLEEYLSDCDFFIEKLNEFIWPAVDITNPKIEPFTNRLIYNYDFGDDWTILITCINKTAGKIDEPICVEAEGLNLIEDCGGIGGYIEVLRNIEGLNGPAEKQSSKEWARSMGFTGRKHKPQSVL